MSDIPSIDDMPHLKARLGAARSDRVRYVGKASHQRQSRATNIPNELRETLMELEPANAGSNIMDILQGVARSDEHNTKALSTSRLLNILQCAPIINTREVTKMLNISDQNARKYVRALKIAYPLIERELQLAT